MLSRYTKLHQLFLKKKKRAGQIFVFVWKGCSKAIPALESIHKYYELSIQTSNFGLGFFKFHLNSKTQQYGIMK